MKVFPQQRIRTQTSETLHTLPIASDIKLFPWWMAGTLVCFGLKIGHLCPILGLERGSVHTAGPAVCASP